MRNFLFTIILMCNICVTNCFALGAFAQNTENISDKIYTSISSDVMHKSKGYSAYGMDAEMGYKFSPSFFAYALVRGEKTFYEKDGVKNHFGSENLGVGLGYRLEMKDTNRAFDFKASAAMPIGNNDWKCNTYDVGIVFRYHMKGLSPHLGCGFRYKDSKTKGIPNHGAIYGSLGFSF